MKKQTQTKKRVAPVVWLRPLIRKGAVFWNHTCEADVTTPQTIDWRKQRGLGARCDLSAKIDFRGKKLCTRHASLRALDELVGPMPELQP